MFEVTRGDIVGLTTSPKDKYGALVYPDTVIAYFNYVTLTGRATASVTLTYSTGDLAYTGSWDTNSVACIPGVVDGSIQCLAPAAAEDFQFEIMANGANQGA